MGLEICVLYEDSDIILCIKPSGILSQKDRGESMVSVLSSRCGSEIYPLHRLDKEVSGVMVYAKNKKAAAFLSREISERRMKKEYIALVHGRPEKERGEMCDLLFKDSSKNKSYVVKRMRKGVKDARLEYEVLDTQGEADNAVSKVRILLHTGRTHQIRVQFSSRQMPLVGDRRYGARDGAEVLCLWSHRLTFAHPKTKKIMTFSFEPNTDPGSLAEKERENVYE